VNKALDIVGKDEGKSKLKINNHEEDINEEK